MYSKNILPEHNKTYYNINVVPIVIEKTVDGRNPQYSEIDRHLKHFLMAIIPLMSQKSSFK